MFASCFRLVYYLDPSVLTGLSCTVMLLCLADYLVPTLAPRVFGSNKWWEDHPTLFWFLVWHQSRLGWQKSLNGFVFMVDFSLSDVMPKRNVHWALKCQNELRSQFTENQTPWRQSDTPQVAKGALHPSLGVLGFWIFNPHQLSVTRAALLNTNSSRRAGGVQQLLFDCLFWVIWTSSICSDDVFHFAAAARLSFCLTSSLTFVVRCWDCRGVWSKRCPKVDECDWACSRSENTGNDSAKWGGSAPTWGFQESFPFF